MFNYIKMDLYRMMRSMYTWVSLALIAGLCFFASWVDGLVMQEGIGSEESGFAQGFMDGLEEEEASQETDEIKVNIMIGPQMDTTGVADGEVINIDTAIIADISSGLFSIVFSIFVVLFVNAEQKNGFIKNIGKLKNRWMLCISKIAVIAVYLFGSMLIWCLGRFVFGIFMYEQELAIESLVKFFPRIGALYLLNLALGCLMLMLVTISRSTALGITIGVLIPTGFVALFYVPIDFCIHKVESLAKVSISDYMLDTNMNRVLMAASSQTVRNAAIVGCVWLIATVVLSIWVKNKRDIC